GWVVSKVEIEQIFPAGKFFHINVAAKPIALLPGCRVTEKNSEIVFADAGFEKPQRLEPHRRGADHEIEPADAVSAPLIAAGRHDDGRFRFWIRGQRQLVAI